MFKNAERIGLRMIGSIKSYGKKTLKAENEIFK
jgi:hypothetical protein